MKTKSSPDSHPSPDRHRRSLNASMNISRHRRPARGQPLGTPTYCEDPETSAIKSNTVNSRQVTQDPPVQGHARIVVDRVDGGEALRSRQLSPTKDLNC